MIADTATKAGFTVETQRANIHITSKRLTVGDAIRVFVSLGYDVTKDGSSWVARGQGGTYVARIMACNGLTFATTSCIH